MCHFVYIAVNENDKASCNLPIFVLAVIQRSRDKYRDL